MKEENKEKKTKYNKLKQISDYTFNFKPGNSFFHKLTSVSKMLWFVMMTFLVLIQSSLIILSVIMFSVFCLAKASGIWFTEILRKLRWIIIYLCFANLSRIRAAGNNITFVP